MYYYFFFTDFIIYNRHITTKNKTTGVNVDGWTQLPFDEPILQTGIGRVGFNELFLLTPSSLWRVDLSEQAAVFSLVNFPAKVWFRFIFRFVLIV
jgi:hypothetical protein